MHHQKSHKAAAWACWPLLGDTVPVPSLASSRTYLTEDGRGDISSEWLQAPSACGGKALSPLVSGGMILCLLNPAGSWLRGKLGMLCSGVGSGFSSKRQHGGKYCGIITAGLCWLVLGRIEAREGWNSCLEKEREQTGCSEWVVQITECSSRQVPVFISWLQCHCSYASGTYSWETSLFCRLQRYCTGAVQCLFIINKLFVEPCCGKKFSSACMVLLQWGHSDYQAFRRSDSKLFSYFLCSWPVLNHCWYCYNLIKH